MFRGRLCLIAFAVLFLGSSSWLHGFDDWLPINQDELKMKADAEHQGDAIILYHEEIANDINRHRWVYKRLKVLTEKGKDRANVEIPYDASFVGISDIKARTIAPDGTITPFTGKAFNSTIVKAHGLKYLAKTFSLPNVQVGSIIEWKYAEYWDDYVLAPSWSVQDDLFTKRAKFSFTPLTSTGDRVIDSRGDIKDRVYYTLVGLPEKTAIKTNARNALELELKDIPAFEEEDFAPPAAVLKMRVNFYYGTEKMTKPAEFWKTEGKYWSREVDKFAGHSASVAKAVAQTTSPSDTPEQKARKIYTYVQTLKNLTFINQDRDVQVMLTQEARAKRTVDDVLGKKEGYRDELARLFWGMAKAANIPAYMMRVADRDEYWFQPGIPNPAQLTSEIAIVTIDGKEIFLDPGTPLCAFGQLAWQHTSTQGMRQTADGGTGLFPTPGIGYKDAISKRVSHLRLSEDGSAKGKIGIAWAGEEALIHRLNSLKTDTAGTKKELEDELKAMLPEGALVTMDSSSGWDDVDKQLTANFTVEVPSYASNAGKRMLVPTNLFQTRNRQPFVHGERKQPVYFSYPFYSMDETQITLPSGFHVENLPEVQPLHTAYSLYKVQHNTAENVVTTSRDFAMAEIAFKPTDYAELRTYFSGVNNGDSQPLVLTSAQ